MSGIQLVVGLGNPGREYEQTRHNAGFWFVDALAAARNTSFHKETKFAGEVAKFQAGGQTVWLLKPGTYMNRSGRSVAALANFYRILPAAILVAHDELDLMPGQTRLKRGGGVAGHNGLRDIQAHMGSADFWRLRFGIGHPRTLNLQQAVVDFVLHPPSAADRGVTDEEIERAVAASPEMIAGLPEAAMMKLHARPRAAG
ncbi:MAG TPA: aminoacyl-tRNA hydrolase [Burkholderiaceae bacterium]|nr:aminoacyl-tRNA hydrolase [Burkholderiaceae bacterium]